jgi:hypothetical protein
MGLSARYLTYIDTNIASAFGDQVGLRLLELGDQLIREPKIPFKTGKDYFESRGFAHTSIDLNGMNGSEVRDLREPKQFIEWKNKWDIITNSGTTEHVEPRERQYEVFSILHQCTKIGGINIHLIPDVSEMDGIWKHHCTNYYSANFFEALCRECGYEVRSNTIINGLRCVVTRKLTDKPFVMDREFFLSNITFKPMPFHVMLKYKVGDWLRRMHLRDNG